MKKNILFLPVILLINACSSLPEIDSQLQSRQWINHQVLVSDLRSWNIKGRAAIQNKYNSGTFVLHWNQHNTDFELRFISSFRQGKPFDQLDYESRLDYLSYEDSPSSEADN